MNVAVHLGTIVQVAAKIVKAGWGTQSLTDCLTICAAARRFTWMCSSTTDEDCIKNCKKEFVFDPTGIFKKVCMRACRFSIGNGD